MKTFAVIASIALTTTCAQKSEGTAPPAPVAAQKSDSNIQDFTIDVAGAFTPASVTLKAGQRARLHFKRTAVPTCADEIVFPDLGIRKKLPPNQTTTVELPSQPARTVTFACGMNMLKGSVIVQ